MIAPRGKGIYVRDPDFTMRAAERLDHAFLHGDSSKLDARASRLRDLHIPFWIYALPGAWSPGSWEATLRRFEGVAKRVGAAGIVCDAENGWESPSLDGAARELGDALGAAEGHNGFTSYPLMGRIRAVGQGAKGRVWGQPQIYLRDTLESALRNGRGKATVEYWIDRYQTAFGTVVPAVSIALLPGTPPFSDVRIWDAYFASLPHVRGATAWDAEVENPRAWDTYRPGLPFGNRAVLLAEVETGLPIAALAAAVGTTVALLTVATAYYVTKGG